MTRPTRSVIGWFWTVTRNARRALQISTKTPYSVPRPSATRDKNFWLMWSGPCSPLWTACISPAVRGSRPIRAQQPSAWAFSWRARWASLRLQRARLVLPVGLKVGYLKALVKIQGRSSLSVLRTRHAIRVAACCVPRSQVTSRPRSAEDRAPCNTAALWHGSCASCGAVRHGLDKRRCQDRA